MISKDSLVDKVIVVTGGNGGIGKSIVHALYNHGATLIIADIKIDDELKENEAYNRGNILFIETDLTVQSEVIEMFEQVIKKYGKVTHLINAIGIGCNKPFLDITHSDFANVMNVNLYSIILSCQAAIPYFKRDKYGFIINLSSTLAYSCLPANAPYTLTKSALCALTRTLAKEFVEDGIVVNSVCPTIVKTKMFMDFIRDESKAKGLTEQEFYKMCVNTLPQKRALEPEEVANSVLYLCFDTSRGITGQSIMINGGSYMY